MPKNTNVDNDLDRIQKVVKCILIEDASDEEVSAAITEFIGDLLASKWQVFQAKQLKRWERRCGIR